MIAVQRRQGNQVEHREIQVDQRRVGEQPHERHQPAARDHRAEILLRAARNHRPDGIVFVADHLAQAVIGDKTPVPHERAAQHGQIGEEHKENQVDRNARDGHQKIVPVAVAPEVIRVDRHGLGIAEPHEEHQDGAHGVEMAQRVERQPPGALGRVVAATVSHIGVPPLVAAQADQHGERAENRLIEKGNRLAEQRAQVVKHRRSFRIGQHLGLCPIAPPKGFRFRLFVSATGSNNRKPLWKPSGTNTSFYFRNICVVILTVPLPIYRGNIRNFGYFFFAARDIVSHMRGTVKRAVRPRLRRKKSTASRRPRLHRADTASPAGESTRRPCAGRSRRPCPPARRGG